MSKNNKLTQSKEFLINMFKSFTEDNCTFLAAGLSYYTTFAVPSMLIVIIMVGSIFVDSDEIKQEIIVQVQNLLGENAEQQIKSIIENSKKPDKTNFFGISISIIALIFSATGAFQSVQKALNNVWGITFNPETKKSKAIIHILFKRFLSFCFVLIIAFLLLLSLVTSSFISAFGVYIEKVLPDNFSAFFILTINTGITFTIVSILFIVMLKILPDAKISLKDVWVGGIFTSVLFMIGNTLFNFYLGKINLGGLFGAASSFAITLLWVYYSSIIFLLGAEFTQTWVRKSNKIIEPDFGSVKFKKKINN